MSNEINFNYELQKIGECVKRIKRLSYRSRKYLSSGARADCDREMIMQDLKNIEYWTSEMRRILIIHQDKRGG